MSDTTVIILLTVGLFLGIILTAYQENKIKKLEKENAVLKTKLEMK